MLSGFSKVKYGLQKPKPKEKPGAKERKPAAPIAAFAGSDDEDNVEAEIARQASKNRSQQELEAAKAAVAQDPSIYDYDGVYEDMKAAAEQPLRQEKQQRQSRYIGQLLKKATEREREANVVYERKLAKERAAEEHLFGDKEKFVTAAYKKKLEEDARWLAEEKRREEEEARNDVTKKGDLSDFYRNLLNKNVAFGGSSNGTERPREGNLSKVAASKADQLVEHSRRSDKEEPQAVPKADVSARQNADAGEAKEIRDVQKAQASAMEQIVEVAPADHLDRKQEDTRIGESLDQGKGEKENPRVEQPPPILDVTEQGSTAKRDAVDTVAAARERYLARKKQRPN